MSGRRVHQNQQRRLERLHSLHRDHFIFSESKFRLNFISIYFLLLYIPIFIILVFVNWQKMCYRKYSLITNVLVTICLIAIQNNYLNDYPSIYSIFKFLIRIFIKIWFSINSSDIFLDWTDPGFVAYNYFQLFFWQFSLLVK